MHKRVFILTFGFCLLVIDRGLKFLAEQSVSWHVGGAQFISFHNLGVIFSWPMPNAFAIGLMAVAIAAVGWLTVKHWPRGGRLFLGSWFILLGAFSNLYDRVMHRYIVDYVFFGNWFPIFNLADVMIACGLVVLLISLRRPENNSRVHPLEG